MVVGGGLDVIVGTRKLVLDARYTFGAQMMCSTSPGDPEAKNGALTISVGVGLLARATVTPSAPCARTPPLPGPPDRARRGAGSARFTTPGRAGGDHLVYHHLQRRCQDDPPTRFPVFFCCERRIYRHRSSTGARPVSRRPPLCGARARADQPPPRRFPAPIRRARCGIRCSRPSPRPIRTLCDDSPSWGKRSGPRGWLYWPPSTSARSRSGSPPGDLVGAARFVQRPSFAPLTA